MTIRARLANLEHCILERVLSRFALDHFPVGSWKRLIHASENAYLR